MKKDEMSHQENERKLKGPMKYGMYPLFDCEGLETPVKIDPEFIVSRGKSGFCDDCQKGVLETTDGRKREAYELWDGKEKPEINISCRHCCIEDYGEYDEMNKYTPSDAKFRCPAYKTGKGCDAKDLSYEQFVVGLCCDAGIEWTVEPEEQRHKLAFLHNSFEKSERELIQAEKNYYGMFDERREKENCLYLAKKKAEEAEKAIETAKENAKKAQDHIKKMEKAAKKAKEELKKAQEEEDTSKAKFKAVWGKVEKQEKIHSRTRKRFSFCSFKYSERCQWEPPRKFRKTHDMKNFCKLCHLPYYDGDDHQKALLPCGHSFGWKCIQGRRICPKHGCDKRFTPKQIYREAESEDD